MDKVAISERAFVARMKRNLSKDGLMLKSARPDTRSYHDLGPFYTVNDRNVVEHKNVELADLENWARESGVLKPFEALSD
jgi:hypothetical protein